MHFHDLRHAGNHYTASPGANLRELMERMGHSTRATTHVTSERDSHRQSLSERSSLGTCLTAGGRSIFRGWQRSH
jgi:integrase